MVLLTSRVSFAIELHTEILRHHDLTVRDQCEHVRGGRAACVHDVVVRRICRLEKSVQLLDDIFRSQCVLYTYLNDGLHLSLTHFLKSCCKFGSP
jgi:hypothetical protein